MIKPIAALLALSLTVGCARAQQAEPEVRGTWLTTTANTALSSPQNTAETMKRLREIGLNTAYIECWKNGYTEFPSETMKRLIGVEMKINNTPAELQRDLLKETVIEAHRNGLLAIGWLEYGFMAAFKDTNNELRALGLKEGWLTTNREGEIVGKQNAFVWMNPLHPVPQQLLIDITIEAIKQYDLDGVQLDDRIAMPVEMGYDPYTIELYKKEHDGRSPPEDHRDPAWVQWRADKITEYARRYAREVRRAAGRDIIISVSPAPYPWSLENYACDWPKWFAFEGDEKWDEYIPQNYRFNYDRTAASIQECIDAIPESGKRLMYAGIRIVGDGPDMPIDDLLKSIEFCRKAGIGGHVHWFSRGVLEVYPNELQQFYDVQNKGAAPHPLRKDWRKPAIPARRDGNQWLVSQSLDRNLNYVFITKKNGQWTYGPKVQHGNEILLQNDGYEAVEVLIDRKN